MQNSKFVTKLAITVLYGLMAICVAGLVVASTVVRSWEIIFLATMMAAIGLAHLALAIMQVYAYITIGRLAVAVEDRAKRRFSHSIWGLVDGSLVDVQEVNRSLRVQVDGKATYEIKPLPFQSRTGIQLVKSVLEYYR